MVSIDRVSEKSLVFGVDGGPQSAFLLLLGPDLRLVEVDVDLGVRS